MTTYGDSIASSEGASSGPQRRYLHVIEEVLQAIGIGTITSGDRLPSERHLAQQCGASRSSVREALLVLEVSGIVEVRAGSGYYVAHSGSHPYQRAALSTQSSPREILEVRQLIEPAVARLCALQASSATISRLETMNESRRDSTVESVSDINQFISDGLAFHRELANACDNKIMAALIDQLVNVNNNPLALLVDNIGARNHIIRAQQIEEHAAILGAIQKNKPDAAARAMEVHLGTLSTRIFGHRENPSTVRRTRRTASR